MDELEDILGLVPGSLAGRLGPSRRLRRSRVEAQDELVGRPGTLRPLLEMIGCADLDELESLGGSLVVDIGSHRRIRAVANRMLWRARIDGALRTHIVLRTEDPTDVPPTATVLGADIGRSAYDPVHGWAVWELVFPRPLTVGETAMVEWTLDGTIEEEGETLRVQAVADRRVEEASLWLRFDDALPRLLESFEDTNHGFTRRVAHPAGGAAEHHVRDFGPGTFGFLLHW